MVQRFAGHKLFTINGKPHKQQVVCVHRNIYVANGSPGINTQLEVRKTGWALTGLAYASLTVCFGK